VGRTPAAPRLDRTVQRRGGRRPARRGAARAPL